MYEKGPGKVRLNNPCRKPDDVHRPASRKLEAPTRTAWQV
jgi:hypothetical protein